MSSDLVPYHDVLPDRRSSLQALTREAENAVTPQEAFEVMVKGKTITHLLNQIKAPLEESRLAGKASVLAARRLGRLLSEISSQPIKRTDGLPDWAPSERGIAIQEIGLHKATAKNLVRLYEVDSSEFQRYIQREDKIPSIDGAFRACKILKPTPQRNRGSWRSHRRAQAGVKQPPNPSLDEAYSLIVKALGHLSSSPRATNGTREMKADIRSTVDLLYAAEDRLRPYRGGYVS